MVTEGSWNVLLVLNSIDKVIDIRDIKDLFEAHDVVFVFWHANSLQEIKILCDLNFLCGELSEFFVLKGHLDCVVNVEPIKVRDHFQSLYAYHPGTTLTFWQYSVYLKMKLDASSKLWNLNSFWIWFSPEAYYQS